MNFYILSEMPETSERKVGVSGISGILPLRQEIT